MQRTIEAIEKHLSAIRWPLYEVGVYFPVTEERPDSRMLLRTWDSAALLKSVPWLRAKNAEGAQSTSGEGEHAFSLVDDLHSDSVKRMGKEGFNPAIVIETSPGNFQAWLNQGDALDKRTSTAAARALADRFGGDPGAADWRHFGRLCGFTNRKPSHVQSNGLFPFVRAVEHQPGVYTEAFKFVQEVRQSLREQPSGARVNSQFAMNRRMKPIEEFRADPRIAATATGSTWHTQSTLWLTAPATMPSVRRSNSGISRKPCQALSGTSSRKGVEVQVLSSAPT